ncbi:MAG: putative transcriptional regulator [Firmicutes bacterium]|nr:putative transcriptional regulator [Bacillota bacterium]
MRMKEKSLFAERLTDRRVELNYTQESFAKLVGMSRARYANYEQSRREPDLEIAKLFAKHLKTTTDYLIGNDDPTSVFKVKEPKMPKDLKKILEQQEIMFSGTPLDEEDKQEILDIIQYHLYKRAKELNKRKPKGDVTGE